MDLSWIVGAIAMAVLVAWYISYGAARLDRLHTRVEGALSVLDAQLVRRAEATLELANCGALDPASALILAGAATDSLEADTTDQRSREAIESDLTQALELALGNEALRGLRADRLVGAQTSQGLIAKGQLQGLGQVALDGFTGPLVRGVRLERVGGRAGQDQGAGRVERAAVGELESGFGPADQLSVQHAERALNPGVQPVEPGGAVRDVPGDQHRHRDRADDPAEVHHVPPGFLPLRRNRAHRESDPPEALTMEAPNTTVS